MHRRVTIDLSPVKKKKSMSLPHLLCRRVAKLCALIRDAKDGGGGSGGGKGILDFRSFGTGGKAGNVRGTIAFSL